MVVTKIDAEILRSAMRRQGIWFVTLAGNTTDFYHRCCYNHRTQLKHCKKACKK